MRLVRKVCSLVVFVRACFYPICLPFKCDVVVFQRWCGCLSGLVWLPSNVPVFVFVVKPHFWCGCRSTLMCLSVGLSVCLSLFLSVCPFVCVICLNKFAVPARTTYPWPRLAGI